VWRRRAPRRKPSASGRLEAAPEAARSTETGLRRTGSTRPGARDLPGIGPNRYPLPGVIRLEFLSPETCRQHGVEPFAYFRDVLERVPTIAEDQIAELTPWAWKAAAS